MHLWLSIWTYSSFIYYFAGIWLVLFLAYNRFVCFLRWQFYFSPFIVRELWWICINIQLWPTMVDAEDLGSESSIVCSEPSGWAKLDDDGHTGCTSHAPLYQSASLPRQRVKHVCHVYGLYLITQQAHPVRLCLNNISFWWNDLVMQQNPFGCQGQPFCRVNL